MSVLPTALGLCVAFAVLCTILRRLRPLAFGLWIAVACLAALVFPEAFLHWGRFDLAKLIVPLLQVIMFGMGTTLTAHDFGRALRRPLPVLIGIGSQFLIMPLIGWMLATSLDLPPEIAVGVILVGSVSGGVASNLMVFLARGDVALSVTMTACSTLMSPLVTPLLTKWLAGALVPISIVAMMLSILNMIIVPVIAGLLAHELLYSSRKFTKKVSVMSILLVIFSALAGLLTLSENFFAFAGSLRSGITVGLGLLALVSLVKIVAIVSGRGGDFIARILPFVSMAGIWLIIAIITARSRATVLEAGGLLMLVAAIHNSAGYLLGYWSGRLTGQSEEISRTIAFEVGMQNSGMAAGLAMDALKSAPAALAPAIFGPWMNITGSLLASWWGREAHESSAECLAEEREISAETMT
ncbi:bile acid:sodium symporter family protein [Rubinisphaera margarita]|uniref:bile acid:sodium symporter family protein n=1 Tax=Rubinisphaera margarita TaxID=2909586 RepID=UPI001EE89CB5|nr:bile acid:sodium symporter family protein [Rubinisphaera margarita]MCG6155908.1 bile acid:sodium symporter family protein [Rubinisphaera margarita]